MRISAAVLRGARPSTRAAAEASGAARGVEEVVDEALAGRGHVQAADVDLAARADDDAVRVGEIDLAADPAFLDGIEHAVDRGLLVAHQIDERGGAVGQVEVGGLAAADIEAAEELTALPLPRRRSVLPDVGGVRAERAHAGRGAAVGDDVDRPRQLGHQAVADDQRASDMDDDFLQARRGCDRLGSRW